MPRHKMYMMIRIPKILKQQRNYFITLSALYYLYTLLYIMCHYYVLSYTYYLYIVSFCFYIFSFRNVVFFCHFIIICFVLFLNQLLFSSNFQF